MEPITLRLPNELLDQLSQEFEELGYSSRSEYIRHILQHRSQVRDQLPELSTGSDDNYQNLKHEVNELKDKVEELETEVGIVGNNGEKNDFTGDSFHDNNRNIKSMLNDIMRRNGPKSEQARDTIIKAACILSEEGPKTTKSLKNELYDGSSSGYSSAKSMWQSTIQRYYNDIPGFNRNEQDKYEFNEKEVLEAVEKFKKFDDFD